MSNPIVIACLVAVFSWWFFTGVILLLVRYSDSANYRIRQLYALFSVPFILVGFLLWYLIIKPYDYLVTFKIKTTAGTINQSIKLWNTSIENTRPIQQENLKNLTQQIIIKDSTYNYEWSISSLNDSISKVSVYVTDIDHSFANKRALE